MSPIIGNGVGHSTVHQGERQSFQHGKFAWSDEIEKALRAKYIQALEVVELPWSQGRILWNVLRIPSPLK
jgi:hypothetical protein